MCVHFILSLSPHSQFPQAPGSTQSCMRSVLLAPGRVKARLSVWPPPTTSFSASLSGTIAGAPLEDLSNFLPLRRRPAWWWVPPRVPRRTQTCFWAPPPRPGPAFLPARSVSRELRLGTHVCPRLLLSKSGMGSVCPRLSPFGDGTPCFINNEHLNSAGRGQSFHRE